MAFPAIVGSQISSRSTNAQDDVVPLPASIAAGDLIIHLHSSDTSQTRTWPSPWAEIKDTAVSGNVSTIGVAYLIASGGETEVTVTKLSSERHSSIAIRISAASWHGTTPPEVSTGATGDDTTPDPDAVTASWGSEDNLFIAVAAFDNSAGAGAITAFPTNYAGNNLQSPDITSCGRNGIGTRELAAASDDPGTFTMSPTDQWWAGTIVVRPAGGAPAFSPPHNLMILGVGR